MKQTGRHARAFAGKLAALCCACVLCVVCAMSASAASDVLAAGAQVSDKLAVASTKAAAAITTDASAAAPSGKGALAASAASQEPIVVRSSLPSFYDARDDNLISPVRLQDPWGACWAFGSLAAIEANLVKQGLISQDTHLSPRHLIYFAGTPAEDIGAQTGEGQHPADELVALYGENAVFEMGGHAQEVASAISTGEGVAFEADFPYQNDEGFIGGNGASYASDGTWTLPEDDRYTSAFTLLNMHRLPSPGGYSSGDDLSEVQMDFDALDAVKQAILDYGAVSASYCSYRGEDGQANYYDAEHATFFTNETTDIDHDICIIGWDNDYSRLNFTTGKDGSYPEGDGAWIVKNSWGASTGSFPNKANWGDGGYFYLSYFDRSVTGFTAWEMAARSTSDAEEIINQHDYMGQRSNSETRVTYAAPRAYANNFVAETDQLVKPVSVNTYAPRTEVSIRLYLLPDDAGSSGVVVPTRGKLLASKDVVCDWAGYHRIALDGSYLVREGQRFSVVVSMVEVDAAGNRVYVASIEAANNKNMLSDYGLSHYDTVICNPGETSVLVTIGGKTRWIDGAEYAAMLHDIAIDEAYFGNACIKVFSDYYYEESETPESADPDEGAGSSGSSKTAKRPAYKASKTAANATAQAAPSNTQAHAPANTADANSGLVAFLLVVLALSGTGVFRYRP